MLKQKSIKRTLFLVLMALCSVLLCFVGVWAVNNINLSYTGKVDADILCKIEIKEANDSGFTTIFDNYNQISSADATYSDFFQKDSSNNYYLKNYTSTSGGVASELSIKLTNYTVGKNINLAISNVSATHTVSDEAFGCATATQSSDTITPTTNTLTLVCAQTTDTTNNKLTFAINVTEAYQITIEGDNLTEDDNLHYIAKNNTTTKNIALSTQLNNQLPTSISFTNSQTATYSRTNNLNGNVAISTLTDNTTITCNCVQVYKVLENQATSIINSDNAVSGDSNSYYVPANATLLPNNGKYTVEKVSDTTTMQKYSYANSTFTQDQTNGTYYKYTLSTGFEEYKYYVEMGYYPQQIALSSIGSGLTDTNTILPNTTEKIYKDSSNNLYVKSTINTSLFSVNNLSTSYTFNSSVADSNYIFSETDSYSVTTYYAYFKIDPIVWLVVGVEGGTLANLSYDSTSNMLCTDTAHGKFGNLILMSALALNTSQFSTSTSNNCYNYSNSALRTNTNETDPKSSFLWSTTSTLFNLKSTTSTTNYIAYTSLNTFTGDSSINTTTSDNFFSLAGVDISSGTYQTTSDTTQSYHYNTYCNVAQETNLANSFTSGIATATDYAIVHGAKVAQTSSADNIFYSAIVRGWDVQATAGTSTLSASSKATCAYWARSAVSDSNTEQASVVNVNGEIRGTQVTDTNICVRPCCVLNGNFCSTGTYTAYTNS